MIEFDPRPDYCKPNSMVADTSNPWLHGGFVRSLYFHGYLMHGHHASNGEKIQEDLNNWKPRSGVIYNAALAAQQRKYIGPMLVARGFKLAETSRNPNTGYSISFYVLDPKDHIAPDA